ncbi:MAG: ABC transporter ATP-binding protein [Opitutaceae bacterium]|jgi:lipopolysaccharide transport system ATP-binding protein
MPNDNDIAIDVQGLSKAYRIWRDPTARLKFPLFQAVGSVLSRSLQPKALRRRIGESHETPYYKDFYALQDINFTVRKGEAVGIVGRNGSGKSTLLQIIAGTLTPTTGTSKVNGRVAALLELGSGFNPEFTGRENVYLNAIILGLSREEIDRRFDDIAAFADIGDFIEQPTKTYSSGMTMRLAFAVIAHVDANILIVDEALAVGDAFFVQKCMRFIREFQKYGTLLLVTHDTSALTSLCSRAIWLHHGKNNGSGTAQDIAEQYLEATYAEKQGASLFSKKVSNSPKTTRPCQDERIVDQRIKFINQSNLRNDIEIFNFNPDSSAFGAGGAIIEHVSLLDAKTRQALVYGVGGEKVILSITVRAKIQLKQPIVGFYLKNNLGTLLFGDNTYLSYHTSPHSTKPNEVIVAQFQFQMPYLPPGSYMIAAAVADGNPNEHVQHHWLHEALPFTSHSSHCSLGLVGIPMQTITLNIVP